MGLFTEHEEETNIKNENWWLRLAIVLIVLTSLGGMSVVNRGIITERKVLTDSLRYYRVLSDSIRNDWDSLYDENFELNHANGILNLQIYDLSHENPKYRNLENDLEKLANSNRYE